MYSREVTSLQLLQENRSLSVPCLVLLLLCVFGGFCFSSLRMLGCYRQSQKKHEEHGCSVKSEAESQRKLLFFLLVTYANVHVYSQPHPTPFFILFQVGSVS